ncbi:glycosyltransferase family 2 protein [Microbacterium hydrocarbonoxydans]|uniref:glycosyltransferase family 2 protein n=1 Tax=Microbacterium hydrocarbonoxydans TaxID=273678 RepID=UPI0007BBD5F0|nr:glycosyltransferase family A protein [Microbacterium hydrocarbonoxydans]GAT72218.1 probable glycosyl transferase [Microbacterium sp. HM58-2]
MADPTVTVIIPTNKGGRYLAEAVASVRAQTSPVHEILLVDDGSPAPGLADVAAGLGVRHLRQEPSGLSVARNTGAAAATGDWIAYLDDDDVWHPERIAEQLRGLEAAPDAVAACTGGWYMDADGVPFGTGWGARPASAAQLIAYETPPPRITTLLIRREAYLAVGGCRSAMEPAEDNDLILRLLQHGEVASIDRQLVGYRRHGANITSRGLAGREANRRVLADRIEEARVRGDDGMAGLLTRHRRAFRRYAAADNLGELIDAMRRRDWRYAGLLGLWGLRRAPASSLSALARRVTRRAGSS